MEAAEAVKPGNRLLPSPEQADALAAGPGSIVWRYASDARGLITGAGVALLLQVAHPTVAAGVREHSDFERDPWGRLWRTLDFVNLLVYGGPEAAARTGRRLREMHRSIKGVDPHGRGYHALEPEAYAWVHATLCDAILGSHRLFGQRMRPDEVARFYDEWRGLRGPLGGRGHDPPPARGGLCAFARRPVGGGARGKHGRPHRIPTPPQPPPPPT